MTDLTIFAFEDPSPTVAIKKMTYVKNALESIQFNFHFVLFPEWVGRTYSLFIPTCKSEPVSRSYKTRNVYFSDNVVSPQLPLINVILATALPLLCSHAHQII